MNLWKALTLGFGVGVILCPIVMEVLRAVMHRRRQRRNGLGGTQDIAMWGTFAGLACVLGAIVSGIGWWLST